MKTLKRNGKLKIILAAIIVLIIGGTIVGILSNDEKMASDVTSVTCAECSMTVGGNYSYDSTPGTSGHLKYLVCSACGGRATTTLEQHTYSNGTCRLCGYAHENHNYTVSAAFLTRHSLTCSICGNEVYQDHTYSDGECTTCGYAHIDHTYSDGECTTCGYAHIDHTYSDGECTICGKSEPYDVSSVTCAQCSMTVGGNYSYDNTKGSVYHLKYLECSACEGHATETLEQHTYSNGTCTLCTYSHTNHTYSNGECTVCGKNEPYDVSSITCALCSMTVGGNYEYESAGTATHHKYITCTACGGRATWELEDHSIVEGVCELCGYEEDASGGDGDSSGDDGGDGTEGTVTCTHTYETESDATNHWEQCTKCDAIKEGSTEAHTEVTDAAVAATCKATGLTEGSHCSVCNKVLVAQSTIPTTAHTEVTDAAVAATCETEGKTEGKHCSVCDEILVEQTTIAKLPHTEVTDAAVAATCEETGKTEGKHCSVCNTVLVAQEAVAKIPHSYKNGECEVCGAKQSEECKHEEYEVKSNTTQHWEECKECGQMKTGTLNNHNYETYTSYEDGTHGSTCTVCSYNLKENHTYVDGECEDCGTEEPKVDETCEHDYDLEKNETHHWEECSKCNDKKEQEEHKYGDYTDNNDGTHSATCSVCGYKLTEEHETDGTCEDCKVEEPVPDDGNKGDDEGEGDKEPDNKDEDNKNDDNENKVDNTVIDKEIPHTGIKNIALVVIFTLGVVGAISAVKMRKYKGI